MSALKDNVSRQMVQDLAEELSTAWSDFPTSVFVDEATDGLEELELKDRIRLVSAALGRALPDDPTDLVAVLDAALRSPSFEGWMVWPCAEMLTPLGPEYPDIILPYMARLTHRSSCEFAIRPCIDQHPELTFAYLHRWVNDPDEHVRRLVSEGTRPRLPWGQRLRALQQDPTPSIVLLDRLRDDDSEFVRRSVANHLGDIVKDHPDLALETAQRWRSEGGTHVDTVIRHGLRTLIKAGDPTALQLVGYDADAPVKLEYVRIDPSRLAIGEHTQIELELTTDSVSPVPIVVEYLIHYLGIRGPRKPKAYRLAERTIETGVPCQLRRKQSFNHASIRTLYPGDQLIEVQVNGRVLGSCTLELTA